MGMNGQEWWVASTATANSAGCTAQVESAMGPALQAAFLVMQDYGGKLLLFQNAVPSLGAPRLLSSPLPRCHAFRSKQNSACFALKARKSMPH